MRRRAFPKCAHGRELSYLDVARSRSILYLHANDVCLLWRTTGADGCSELQQRLDLVSSSHSRAVEGGIVGLSSLSVLEI